GQESSLVERADPGDLLDDPFVRELDDELASDGFFISPMVMGQQIDRTTQIVSFLVDGARTTEIDATDGSWSGAMRTTVQVIWDGTEVVATVETRTALEDGVVTFVNEMRTANRPDARFRIHDTMLGDKVESDMTFRLLDNGEWRTALHDGDGLVWEDGTTVEARWGFACCVWDCFVAINTPITYAQALCLGIGLLAVGLAALASGGAGGAAIIPVLQGCGLTFLIARAAAILACVIKCW
ncbi:MAG: hypothetical protein KDA28_07010, partial [Phycisphaerales bacterium]|nr:hypothetical protein [Phycisphaerales bacterium]